MQLKIGESELKIKLEGTDKDEVMKDVKHKKGILLIYALFLISVIFMNIKKAIWCLISTFLHVENHHQIYYIKIIDHNCI